MCNYCVDSFSYKDWIEMLMKEMDVALKERRRIFEWVLSKPEVRQTEIFDWLKAQVGNDGNDKNKSRKWK